MTDPVGPSVIGNPLSAFSNESGSSFMVTVSGATFVANSAPGDFLYVFSVPFSGTITDVAKSVAGVEQYDVSGLNISIGSVISSSGAVLATSALLAGDDSIMGSPFADLLLGGAGNDTIDGGGGNDTVIGGDGNDAIHGRGGNDSVAGGTGNDTIDGGGGKDTVTGGDGNDQFVFDTTLNAHTNLAYITDFTHGQDLIDLSGHIFHSRVGHHVAPIHVNAHTFYAARGAHTAHSVSTHIIYNTKTGALYFDPDGTGHKPAVEFAVLAGHPHLTVHDFQMIA
jgi:Ca2+-binding RTX toxin-like protein